MAVSTLRVHSDMIRQPFPATFVFVKRSCPIWQWSKTGEVLTMTSWWYWEGLNDLGRLTNKCGFLLRQQCHYLCRAFKQPAHALCLVAAAWSAQNARLRRKKQKCLDGKPPTYANWLPGTPTIVRTLWKSIFAAPIPRRTYRTELQLLHCFLLVMPIFQEIGWSSVGKSNWLLEKTIRAKPLRYTWLAFMKSQPLQSVLDVILSLLGLHVNETELILSKQFCRPVHTQSHHPVVYSFPFWRQKFKHVREASMSCWWCGFSSRRVGPTCVDSNPLKDLAARQVLVLKSWQHDNRVKRCSTELTFDDPSHKHVQAGGGKFAGQVLSHSSVLLRIRYKHSLNSCFNFSIRQPVGFESHNFLHDMVWSKPPLESEHRIAMHRHASPIKKSPHHCSQCCVRNTVKSCFQTAANWGVNVLNVLI